MSAQDRIATLAGAPAWCAALAACTLLAGAAGPASARAGTYDVYACGGPAGAAQNAFSAMADSHLSAYSICPPTSAPGTGVATKATSNGGIAPYRHGAYQVFEAPAGAGVQSVSFNLGVIRLAEYWSVGIVGWDDNFDGGDLAYGCFAYRPGCGVGTPSFSIRETVGLNGRRRFRFETRCMSAVGCDVSASPFVPANRALFSAANVSVRVQDSSRPAITPRSGPLWADGWHRGTEDAWSSYRDNVGVMITRLFVDGQLRDEEDYRDTRWPAHVRCDFTRRRPCADIDPGSLAVDTATLSDGEHEARIEAVDAAGNSSAVTRTLRVDNAAPGQVAGLRVAGGDGWRAGNSFGASWVNPPGQVAPIEAAHYRLCPAAGGSCLEGTRRAQGIDGIGGLQVPVPGEWELRVWLEDAAGNHDPDRSAGPVRLRFDDQAPAVAFEAPDPLSPLRVVAGAADRPSGLAGGAIEMRRAPAGAWQEIPTRVERDRLVAAVDDESLPDGLYQLRALAWDRAGNLRSSRVRRDGSPAELSLPVRIPAVLRVAATTAGDAGRCGPRRRSAPGNGGLVVRGAGALVRGYVTAAGVPLAGVRVAVLQRQRGGGSFRAVSSVRADSSGRFRVRLAAGTSRTVRLRYGGTSVIRPALRDLRLLAPARSSIAAGRRLVRNGEAVGFAGRLIGRPAPPGGKLIDLQAFYRGRWRTFATPRSDSRGRWRYAYRFGATQGRVTYRFRARIRREDAYPDELGCTRTVRVTVVG